MSTPRSIPHLSRRFALGTTLASLGALLAIAAAITVLALTGTDNTAVATPLTRAGGGSSETAGLRAEGYTATACAVGGTLMRNYRTGQSVLVRS